ncbi:hypothetical protein PIB30_092586, partial [Stylosanthes scabra]|nr:hypothetical protein [Stylosanthes scabra]
MQSLPDEILDLWWTSKRPEHSPELFLIALFWKMDDWQVEELESNPVSRYNNSVATSSLWSP